MATSVSVQQGQGNTSSEKDQASITNLIIENDGAAGAIKSAFYLTMQTATSVLETRYDNWFNGMGFWSNCRKSSIANNERWLRQYQLDLAIKLDGLWVTQTLSQTHCSPYHMKHYAQNDLAGWNVTVQV